MKKTTFLRSKKGKPKSTCYFCHAVTVDIQKMGGVICGQCHSLKDMDEATRKSYNIGSIRLNQVKCNRCKEVITSTYRHDFVWCKCKAVAVDGGSCYVKRVGGLDGYEERSINF